MTLQAAPAIEDGLPSEEEVRLYEERGYHVAPAIVPLETLDAVRDALDAYQSDARDRSLAARGGFADWRPGDAGAVRNHEFASLQSDVVRRLVHLPVLGRIAARLARSEAVRLFDDQLVCKPPGGGDAGRTVVGWHTDGSYWSTCTSERMLTAWIPLQDTDAGNGTLCVVSGSHLWPESDHVRGFNDTDLASIGRRIGREVPPERVVSIPLRKGQVSFHHMRALHASTPNVSDGPRIAVALHMQDAENRHREFRTPDGTAVELPHDRLCARGPDGRPDYRDPEVFPQLWPAA